MKKVAYNVKITRHFNIFRYKVEVEGVIEETKNLYNYEYVMTILGGRYKAKKLLKKLEKKRKLKNPIVYCEDVKVEL